MATKQEKLNKLALYLAEGKLGMGDYLEDVAELERSES